MTVSIVTVLAVFGAIITLCAIQIIASVRWWHAGRRARAAEAKFSKMADINSRLLEASKNLVEQKKHVDARAEYLEQRFASITNIDAEALELREEIAINRSALQIVQRDYLEKKKTYDRLKSEVAIFDERLALAEVGLYEPHFEFDDSEEYKTAISKIRDRQKQLISNESAVLCDQQWTIGGSESEGRKMIDRTIKLTLRAFNNECEAAIANVRWNNIEAMEKRIVRVREQIDKLNKSLSIFISDPFAKLKLQELYLAHEYRERLKIERDKRKEEARAEREEEKVRRDAERARSEEQHYARLLDKAKAEALVAVGPQLEAYNQKVKVLEQQLTEAHEEAERAQALAERTRSGFVYVISNEGSFGKDVFKIGLTRRAEPEDRIDELGDASVPFDFDIHVMIYSDDAPALESALHFEFEDARINTENLRKEFFNVTLEDVEAAVKRLSPKATFHRDVESREFRETIARRRAQFETAKQVEDAYPVSL